MVLILYHTAGCHLCEEAHGLVLDVLAWQGVGEDALRLVDIAEDEGLLARYGLTIPVLREPFSGTELNWPFGLLELERFLAG